MDVLNPLDLPGVWLKWNHTGAATADGSWNGVPWMVVAQHRHNSEMAVGVFVGDTPGESRLSHIADIDVREIPGVSVSLVDEAQAVGAALLWSRLRALVRDGVVQIDL